jgi:hypothetical protein
MPVGRADRDPVYRQIDRRSLDRSFLFQ